MHAPTRDGAGVAALLRRAVLSGLAPGWVGLAADDGRGGRCWAEGVARIGGAPATPDLLYDLASLTKPLATVTLLLLARRDGVGLETPLGELLDELAGSPWGAATLEACATHTAGFPAWEPLYARGAASREGYLETLAGVPATAPPGRAVVYSDLGFLALGLALERCGGASLDVLFEELVAAPLGVSAELAFAPPEGAATAGGERRPFVEERLLAGRGISGRPPARESPERSCDDGNARALGGAAGHAGLFGSAAAAAELAAEYLPGGGELLTAEEAALATRLHTGGLQQARGLGWQLAATPGCSAGPALPPDAFGHVGFTGTSVWADPASRRVLVLLGNRLHPGGATPDLHPLRRRFNALASGALPPAEAGGSMPV